MGSFGYTVATRATPEQALAYLADLRNLERWVREVDRVEADGDGYRVAREGDAVVARGTGGSMEVVDRWTRGPRRAGPRSPTRARTS